MPIGGFLVCVAGRYSLDFCFINENGQPAFTAPIAQK
jgi:hypothetical protein